MRTVLPALAALALCAAPLAAPSCPSHGSESQSQTPATSATANLGTVTATPPPTAPQGLQIDPKIPSYGPAVSGVSGNVKSIGSETMNNLMALWSEGFKRLYPSVQVEIEAKGSSGAPPALIEGASTFGPMSREMKQQEVDNFEKKFGYKPTGLPTSLDALAVYVHKDNPLREISLQQVDAIFSKTRKGGLDKDIVTWGELGLTGEWANRPISLYGRNSASGTYGYFKDHALFGGDYKDSVKEQQGSAAVVSGVAHDKYGIGYSGLGAMTVDVRAVALKPDASSPAVEANAQNAYSGDYPLARLLYIYVNYKPGTQLDPLRREFIRYVFSKEGQSDVVKDGYFPITEQVVAEALKSVGIAAAVKPVEAGSGKSK
jgi:phosphate transport system substrate-binding protein